MASNGLLLWCGVMVLFCGFTEAVQKAPSVQVYSRHPVMDGKENILQCYAEGFHPPKINVTLLKNNVEIPNVQQSDLSFKDDWSFQLLTYVPVVPRGNDEYSCRVEHSALFNPVIVKWDTSQ